MSRLVLPGRRKLSALALCVASLLVLAGLSAAGVLDEGPLDALLMALATLYGTFAGGNVGEHLSKGQGNSSALTPHHPPTETSR